MMSNLSFQSWIIFKTQPGRWRSREQEALKKVEIATKTKIKSELESFLTQQKEEEKREHAW